MRPIPINQPPGQIHRALLRSYLAEDERARFASSTTRLYVHLLGVGIARGWGKIPKNLELVKLSGLSPKTVIACLRELGERGLLPEGCLVAPTRAERPMEAVRIISPEAAESEGFDAVTDMFEPHERPLLNSFLRQNEGAPIVVVEHRDGEKVVGHVVHRHQSALYRFSQKEQTTIGVRLRMGHVGGGL